jgi:hypothetical protein
MLREEHSLLANNYDGKSSPLKASAGHVTGLEEAATMSNS